MGSVSPPNASGSVWPMTPVDAVTSGRACGGTPNSSHTSAGHCPAAMSNSSVLLAFDASGTCRLPPLTRPIRYESTAPPPHDPPLTPPHLSRPPPAHYLT